MPSSTISLTFPDLNVWWALTTAEHRHHQSARRWWIAEEGVIAFSRITQMGLLRLLTTAAAMDGKPLTMVEAWGIYDSFLTDARVSLIVEPAQLEVRFRSLTGERIIAPKVWTDAYLVAFAEAAGGRVVTFDRAMSLRSASCVLLPSTSAR